MQYCLPAVTTQAIGLESAAACQMAWQASVSDCLLSATKSSCGLPGCRIFNHRAGMNIGEVVPKYRNVLSKEIHAKVCPYGQMHLAEDPILAGCRATFQAAKGIR